MKLSIALFLMASGCTLNPAVIQDAEVIAQDVNKAVTDAKQPQPLPPAPQSK